MAQKPNILMNLGSLFRPHPWRYSSLKLTTPINRPNSLLKSDRKYLMLSGKEQEINSQDLLKIEILLLRSSQVPKMMYPK